MDKLAGPPHERVTAAILSPYFNLGGSTNGLTILYSAYQTRKLRK